MNTKDKANPGARRTRLQQALLDERSAIEAILREAAASGQPLSMLEQGRIDDRIARIKELATEFESLQDVKPTA